MVLAAFVVVAFAAVLAFAFEHSEARRFLKNWAVCTLAVVGIIAIGVLLGEVFRSALCASVWVCKE